MCGDSCVARKQRTTTREGSVPASTAGHAVLPAKNTCRVSLVVFYVCALFVADVRVST